MKTHITLLTLLSLAVLGTACDTGPWDAPPGSEIQAVEDIRVSWFGCVVDPTTGELQNPACEPSPPVQIPMVMQVMDSGSGVPLNNIRISFTSGYGEIYLLPQEVIEAISLPDTENWAEIMQDGEIWAEFTGSWEGEYRPTYYETWTDNNGLARFWIWVNEMPLDATGNPKDTFVRADIGVDHKFVKLTSSQ
jgi:hypothetical protein